MASLLMTACTYSIPRQYLPYPLTNDTFADPVKVVNIPLPVIKTDPNEGLSLGALSSFLLHNKNDEIGTMIVPQVNYNQNFGTTFSLFGAFYPEPGRTPPLPIMALRMVDSLRMHAVSATCSGLPAASRRW